MLGWMFLSFFGQIAFGNEGQRKRRDADDGDAGVKEFAAMLGSDDAEGRIMANFRGLLEGLSDKS